MPNPYTPALTPEQWESRDYRQVARDLDRWAEKAGSGGADDTTEYVAKLGLDGAGSVLAMNRAHDRVVVPPPARLPLAALALLEQPFGFRDADVAMLRRAAQASGEPDLAAGLGDLADRLAALLPPASGPGDS